MVKSEEKKPGPCLAMSAVSTCLPDAAWQQFTTLRLHGSVPKLRTWGTTDWSLFLDLFSINIYEPSNHWVNYGLTVNYDPEPCCETLNMAKISSTRSRTRSLRLDHHDLPLWPFWFKSPASQFDHFCQTHLIKHVLKHVVIFSKITDHFCISNIHWFWVLIFWSAKILVFPSCSPSSLVALVLAPKFDP